MEERDYKIAYELEHDRFKALEKRNQYLKKENEALRKLYESLLDFGQDGTLPLARYEYIKARVFDTMVLLNRLNKLNNN